MERVTFDQVAEVVRGCGEGRWSPANASAWLKAAAPTYLTPTGDESDAECLAIAALGVLGAWLWIPASRRPPRPVNLLALLES